MIHRLNFFSLVTLAVMAFLLTSLCGTTTTFAQETKASDQAVIVVVGAEGSDEYREQFKVWAESWQSAASHTQLTTIGLDDKKNESKTQLQSVLAKAANAEGLEEVWLVMIGHGTFDGKRAKFNLHGVDIQADELKQALSPLKQRIVILNCSSSSSPFINALSGSNRVIVTATKDGYQYNFTRFGRYLSDSIDDPTIDLDKDGQTSVLEAFCAASRGVNDFYQQENRIATEHALLDDNGDSKGTPANWFDGVRVNRKSKKGLPDGLLANQVFLNRRGIENSLSAEDRKTRDQLETQLEQIRSSKGKMDETQYLLKIEPIMVQLAQLYEKAGAKSDEALQADK